MVDQLGVGVEAPAAPVAGPVCAGPYAGRVGVSQRDETCRSLVSPAGEDGLWSARQRFAPVFRLRFTIRVRPGILFAQAVWYGTRQGRGRRDYTAVDEETEDAHSVAIAVALVR